jgi:hypothetical protein
MAVQTPEEAVRAFEDAFNSGDGTWRWVIDVPFGIG